MVSLHNEYRATADNPKSCRDALAPHTFTQRLTMQMKTTPLLLSILLMMTVSTTDICAVKPRRVVFEPTAMRYGDTTRTTLPFAKDPTVIQSGRRYLMYYTIPAYEKDKLPADPAPQQEGWNAAIAESRDMIEWTRVADLDLRDSQGNRIWGCIAPCVKVLDGKIHLFYQRWTESEKNNNIWHAVSTDGITFTNTCDGPIFVPRNDWSINRSIDAEVYRVGRKLILAFATRDKSGQVQMIGMAEAPYGSDYGPDKWTELTTDGPLLKPDYKWEGHCIEAPTVIRHRGMWYMFYAGAYNHEHQMIGLATSTDGRHYRRVGEEGLVFTSGEEGTWNAGESGHPGVFRDRRGRTFLFFQGKATPNGNYRLSVCRIRFKRK